MLPSVCSLDELEMLVVQSLDDTVAGGDVETAGSPDGDPPGVGASLGPAWDDRPDEVAGGETKVLFGAGESEPGKPVLVDRVLA